MAIKVISLIFRLFLCLTLTACSNHQPSLKYIPDNGVILAFGDSLTYGIGTSNDQNYPTVLEKIINRKVINAGIPGLETIDAEILLSKKINDEKPNLIILCLGGNDMLRKRKKEEIANHLKKMIQIALDHQIDIVLIGVPDPSSWFGLNPPSFYKNIAKKYDIPLDNKTLLNLESNNQYKSDSIHLNAQGYRIMAENIADLLKKYGAL